MRFASSPVSCRARALLLVLFLAVVFAAVSVPPARGAAGAKWVLLIGVDDYESEDVSDLRFAVADVKAVGETLQQSVGFPAGQRLHNDQRPGLRTEPAREPQRHQAAGYSRQAGAAGRHLFALLLRPRLHARRQALPGDGRRRSGRSGDAGAHHHTSGHPAGDGGEDPRPPGGVHH